MTGGDDREEDDGWDVPGDEDDRDDFAEASPEPVGTEEKRPGRTYINPRRRPVTDAGRAWVADRKKQIEAVETRTRRRRPADQRTFDATLDAILSDLAFRSLLPGRGLASPSPPPPPIPDEPPQLFLVTRKRNATRYAPPWTFSETLRTTLGTLAKADLIEHRQGGTGEEGRNPTTIAPTGAFLASIRTAGLSVADFGEDLEDFEPVHLKERHGRLRGRKVPGELIAYRDTAETRAWRRELREITAGLFQINLACSLPGIDPSDRAVYRVWNNGRWDQGGRMFGGFWLPMPKRDRREHLRIEGEEIVHVDFGQLHPRLAYWIAGREPPPGDLYALPGLGIEHRDAVKKRLNALLWPRADLGRAPRGQAGLLPPGLTSRTFAERIEEHHHGIAGLFGSDVGYRLLRLEGDLMVAIVRRCLSGGLPVLPVQDCLVCRRADGPAVKEAMAGVFGEMFGGWGIPVGIE